MLAKIWKPIGIFFLIFFCLLNITIKLVNTVSFNTQVDSTVSTPIQEEEVLVNE